MNGIVVADWILQEARAIAPQLVDGEMKEIGRTGFFVSLDTHKGYLVLSPFSYGDSKEAYVLQRQPNN